MPAGSAERDSILVRLAQSRAEISRLLDPPAEGGVDDAGPRPSGTGGGGFPRSRTMRALMSGRGLGAVGAMAGGLLIARPGLAWRLLRILPTSAVARVVVAKVMSAMRGKDRQR